MSEELSRRDFLRLSGALAATAVMASCVVPAPAPTEGEEEAPIAKADRTDFRLWMTWPEDYAACVYIKDKMFPELQAAHPGLEPELNFVHWSDVTRKFVETKAAGLAPDVMNLEDNEGSMWYLGFLYDMMEPVKEWGAYDDLYEPVKEFCSIDGHLFQYPAYYGTKCHLYNKQTFEEVGLDPDNPPDNWEDFLDACIRLTKVDENGNMVRAGYDRIKPSHGCYELLIGRFITQNGGHDFDPSDQATGECWINEPECVEAMQYAVDLVRKHNVYPLRGGNPWPDEVQDELIEGWLGIGEDGPWDIPMRRIMFPEFMEAELLGVMLPLQGPAGIRSANMDCRGTGVSKDSELLEEALTFMKLYSSDVHQKGQFMSESPTGDPIENAWYTTGRKSVNESPDFWVANEPYVMETAYLEALEYGTAPPRRHIGYVDYMEDIAVRAIEEMLFEVKSDQDILDRAKSRADQLTERIVREWG